MKSAAEPLEGEAPDLSGLPGLLGEFLASAGPDVTEIECADALVALDRAANMVEAARCAAVDRFDANLSYVPDAMKSTAAWMRSRTELAPGTARAVVHRARALRVTPAVRVAYGDGVLGTAKVDALIAAREGLEDLFALQEAELVEEVATLEVLEARHFLQRWRAIALATLGRGDDGPEPDPEDQNRFHCSKTFEGRHKIDGDLDAVSGRTLAEAINARIDRYFRNGEVAASAHIPRPQLEARALMDLVTNGAEPGMRHDRPRPSVSLRLDYGELLGLPIDGVSDVWSRACELDDGTPISRSTAERLMCSADITTVLTSIGLDGVIQPLGAVHANRYPTANERAALAVRDGGCAFPGCGAPVGWSDAHHIDRWHLNHRTELDRLVLLCRFHHHAVHEGGHRLDRSRSGVITVIRPDGTRLASRPHAGPLRLIEREGTGPPEPGTGPPSEGSGPPIRPPTRFSTLADRRTRSRRLAANAHLDLQRRFRQLVSENQAKRAS